MLNSSKINLSQHGRSMIEMLGVLAIIGVLSIGGIAGYSKAMNKYRINKTADQITRLAQNIRTLYASQKNYSTLSETVVKKAHLAPEEMYETTDSVSFYDPYGNAVNLHPTGKVTGNDNKAFSIALYGLPQEACIELMTMDWGQGASSGLIVYGKDHWSGYYGCSGNSNYTCPSDGIMPVDKAISVCAGSDSNYIGWKFY